MLSLIPLKMITTFKRLCSTKTTEILLNYSKKHCISTPHIIPAATNSFQSQTNLQICRYKSSGDKNKSNRQVSQTETEEEKDEDFLDNIQDKNTKTLKVGVTSMRLDAIIKAGLGLSRNKIEVIFYESKIRLNGEKVPKKSTHVKEGDEIDVIKGVNVNNPDFLTVARVEVVSAVPKEESIGVKIRRYKSLTVENYKGKDRWQA